MKYKTLHDLLAKELVTEEKPHTVKLIKSLRHVRGDKVLKKSELIEICEWKSIRAIRHIESNHPSTVRSLTRKALSTRSEQKKIEYLIQLRGVHFPMASAALMLINPKRYGVIDFRVWQVLYSMNSVQNNPKGTRFTFENWHQYLSIVRFHAKELGVSVRSIDRTLWLYHQKESLIGNY